MFYKPHPEKGMSLNIELYIAELKSLKTLLISNLRPNRSRTQNSHLLFKRLSLDLNIFVPFVLRSLTCWISFSQNELITLLLKCGLNCCLSREIPYSPIELPEISLQPIRRCYLGSCCQRNNWQVLEFSQLQWIHFLSGDKDCNLKGMHFAICRWGKRHSLYRRSLFNIQALSNRLWSNFVGCTRTPVSLGHHEKWAYPLRVILWVLPCDQVTSANQGTQGIKGWKSITLDLVLIS